MEYPNLVGTPYDYSKKKNWQLLPKDPKKPKKKVDCLWFYPTCCFSTSVIGPVSPSMKIAAAVIFKMMGGPFKKNCNVYAPYYHQLSALKLNDLTDEEIYNVEALEPRTDLYAALDYYFEHYNNGRPFVLAGHSQGSCMISYIMTEYMKLHPDYYDRMIAAYCVGYGLPKELLAEYPHIKPAQGPDDIGVFISWNTEGPENIGQHNFVVRPNSYVINPLNWKTDDTPAKPDKKNKAKADARIDLQRCSVITTADPKKTILGMVLTVLGPLAKVPPIRKIAEDMIVPGFGTHSFHGQDYQFYAHSVSENLKHRIRIYLKEHK